MLFRSSTPRLYPVPHPPRPQATRLLISTSPPSPPSRLSQPFSSIHHMPRILFSIISIQIMIHLRRYLPQLPVRGYRGHVLPSQSYMTRPPTQSLNTHPAGHHILGASCCRHHGPRLHNPTSIALNHHRLHWIVEHSSQCIILTDLVHKRCYYWADIGDSVKVVVVENEKADRVRQQVRQQQMQERD